MKGKKKNVIKVIRGLLGGRMKDYVKVCKAEVIGIRHEGER